MPTVSITTNELALGSSGLSAGTGVAFVAGVTDQGPGANGPAFVQVGSLGQYTSTFGARSTSSAVLYDWLDEYFADGGQLAYVARVSDGTAATASLSLNDASGHPTVEVSALSAGIDGNGIYVSVENGGSEISIEILDNTGDVLETDGPFSTTQALFASASEYVTFTQATGSGNTTALPASVTNQHLTGGLDASDLTAASYVSALDNFPKSLGAGTVALPGQTSVTAWTGLLAHAQANNRFAVLDMADSTVVATIVSAAEALSVSNERYGMFIQGSLLLPGLAPGTTRTVPGSAAVAALRGRVGAGSNQNVAPCGQSYPLKPSHRLYDLRQRQPERAEQQCRL